MKSQIAKQNPVLMQQAIKHYLNNTKGKETPVFTFISFYDDSEPYPLAELITCLEARIEALDAVYRESWKDTDLMTLEAHRKQLAKLHKIAQRMGA